MTRPVRVTASRTSCSPACAPLRSAPAREHATHGRSKVSADARRKIHGRHRLPRQAAGVHLPGLGHLRRPAGVLGLRPARNPAEAERAGRVVGGPRRLAQRTDGARRGAGRVPDGGGGDGDHHAPAGLEVVGALRPVPRRDGRLQGLQVAVPHRPGRRRRGRHERRGSRRGRGVRADRRDARPLQDQTEAARQEDRAGRGGRAARPATLHQAVPGRPAAGVPELRRGADGAAGVQPDVQDDPRRPGRGGRRGLPAARNRPGDVRELQERRGFLPREAAVRDGAGRQELSERDHPPELHVPQPGVRADGGRVLLPARRLRRVVPLLARPPVPLVHGSRAERGEPDPPGARPGRTRPLLRRHRGHRIQVPVPRRGGVRGTRRRRPPRRLRPAEPQRGQAGEPRRDAGGGTRRGRQTPAPRQREELGILRRGDEGEVHAARHRAVRRGRPGDAGVPLRGLRRRRSPGRRRQDAVPHGAAVPPEAGPDQGGGLPAGEEGRDAGAGRGDLRRPQNRRAGSGLRPAGGRRPAVPAAGRDRHAGLRHRRRRHHERRHRHRAGPGFPGTVPHPAGEVVAFVREKLGGA